MAENSTPRVPKFELSRYRQFIREAAPYVSLVVGRRIRALDADKMSAQEITEIALMLDERVKDLDKQ